MHIYIVRHGQSQHNARKIVAGQHESPLTPHGREQAAAAGEQAAALSIDYIVRSPMGRADETARIIADTIHYSTEQIVILPDLRERSLGELEGKSYAHNPRSNGNYKEAEKVPGIEPIDHLQQRVDRALHFILHSSHQNILVVCHMNIGRMLWALAGHKPALGMYDTPLLKNAFIYELPIAATQTPAQNQ